MELISTLRMTLYEQSATIRSLQATTQFHDEAIQKLQPLHATVDSHAESINVLQSRAVIDMGASIQELAEGKSPDAVTLINELKAATSSSQQHVSE